MSRSAEVRPDDGKSQIAQRRANAKSSSRPNYQERRAEIVHAAAQLFKAKGFRGTTLADIADAVGADRASLYYYVGGKAELLDDVVTDVVLANLTRAEEIRDSHADAPTKLRRLVTELMQSYATHYPFLYVYLQENLAHVAKNREKWSTRMRAANRRWESAVESILEQGVEEGTIRPLDDVRVAAYGVIGMVSWTNRWFNPGTSPVGADSIGAAYAEMLLGGLAVPSRTPNRPGSTPISAAPPRRRASRKRPVSAIGQRRMTARDDSSSAYRERREEIRKAAGELFRRQGFRGTSLGQVAEAIDVDRATLYYYVGSKEELFDDVVTEAVRANVALAEDVAADDAPAPDKLARLVTSLMRSYAENYPFLYVFIQENLSHVASARSAWSKEMRALNKRYEDIVVAVVQGGVDEGSLRPVADAWVLAYGVIGMVAWTNRWFNPGRTTVDAEQIAETYAAILLHGLSGPVNDPSIAAGASRRRRPHPPARRRTT